MVSGVGLEPTQCFWEEPLVCEERDDSRVLLKRRYSDVMVPGVGLEPTQCFHRGILNPLRLPISPPGQGLLLRRRAFCRSPRRVTIAPFLPLVGKANAIVRL